MKNINKVILLGYVGGSESFTITEVVKKETGEVYKVANFSLATTRKYKTEKEEVKEETQWHRVVAWNKLAEIVADYVTPGQPLYVEGRIEYRKYTDEDENTRWITEIRASEISILPKREKAETTEKEEKPEPEKGAKNGKKGKGK